MTGVPYQVVVSSENSLYLAWQTQLFCFSAWSALGQWPVVIVHGRDQPLRPEFANLGELGCQVVWVRSYADLPGRCVYPPRNELGSLLEAASISDFEPRHILFCEPDMLFVRRLEYSGAVAAEFYVYLHYEETRVAHAAQKLGVGKLIGYLNEYRRIGVPYLIPVPLVKQLALRWFEVLDAFEELKWIDIMYAFGIAAAVENLKIEITHAMTDNYRPAKPLRGLIHYCFGDPTWDKRYFKSYSPFELPDDCLQAGYPGSVLGEIMRQIRLAKQFFKEHTT